MSGKLLRVVFALFVLTGPGAWAQSPGGVPVASWYKADNTGSLYSDAGVTAVTNNGTVQQWNNSQSGSGNLLQASAGSKPIYSTMTLANFNPTVTFDGSNDWMQFTAGTGVNVIDRANGTIYAAGYVNTLQRSGFFGFNSSMDYPGLHIFDNTKQLLFFTGGPGYQGVSTQAMTANSFFTAGTGWQNGAGTNASYAAATVSLNGTRVNYSGSELLNANLTTAARDLRAGADDNYGSFSGQLNELLVFEDKLTTAQMDQVESYLAIKYGTTYAAGARDYKNSAGGTLWSATTNTGFQSGIAGIARDDNGTLNQKQSWSTNAGQQVLISTTGLANTNAGNATGLSNGQSLIWGDNGLAKSPTVSITGITNISHRLAAIWKVQNTGTVGTVRVAWPKLYSNMVLIQSTDATISSSDVVTTLSGTQTINGVTYAYADVTLTDGQYFTIGAKLIAPGGVTADLRVWLRSDVGFAPAQWQDLSGNQNDFTQTNASRQPVVATQAFNFNPVIDFGTTGNDARFMAIPSGKPYTANGTNSTMFTAQLSNTAGGFSDVLGFGATTTASGLIQANQPVVTKLGNNIVMYPYTVAPTLPAILVNKLYLNDVSFTVGTSGVKYAQNGQISTVTQTVAAGDILHANGGILGAQGEERNGYIGEVVTYQRDLTEPEKQRVRSYVAIKYGMTLPHNYVASDGTTVFWNITTNTGNNNSIAGVARDDDGSLYQKESKSTEASNNVLIGAGATLASSNAADTATLSNGQALMWGDNGLVKSLNVPVAGISGLNLRFASIWKVQNTGSVGTVRVAWPTGTPNLTLIQSTDSVFDATDTRTSMTGNIQTINGTAYNYVDVTLGNGQYFTFAGYVVGPGGVATDLSLWYKGDNGVVTDGSKLVTQWNTSTINSVNLTPNSTTILPYNDQTTYTRTWNFNPTVTFNGTNNYLANTTTAYLNTNGSVHYIAVARNPQRDANARSLFAIAGNDDGFFYSGGGGTTALPAIGNNYNTTSSAIATPYNYGIYSAILPKTGSPANQRGFYNGLMKVYPSPYPFTGGAYSLPTTGAYIGADGTTGDNFNGEIAEVILYHNTAGGDMLNADLARIHSYLAIKYGITLDQTAAQNYVNSSSSVVWDAVSANLGYSNNIAGIGRDDTGSLNQKQSSSVNSGQQVLISTTGLTGSNASNTGALTNGQFLIWGDNNQAKSPTVPLSGIAGVNGRFAAVWKVQNTGGIGSVRVAWPKGYTNLKLIQSTDTTFDATDVVTGMTSTQVVNNITYSYADVALTNGQYFTFAAYIQAPGGVTRGLSHWYRADIYAQASGDSTDVTSWTDFTSGVVSSQLGTAALPKFRVGNATYLNFNPGLTFMSTDQSLGNIARQTLTSLDFDVFTLTKEGMAGSRFFNIGMDNTTFNGNNWDSPGFYIDGGLARRTNTGGLVYLGTPPGPGFSTTGPNIMYHKFSNTFFSRGLNGSVNGTAATHSAIGAVTGGHIFGSNAGSLTGGDDGGFVGTMGEVIIYGGATLNDTERNKVDAYLAIKYGVTLSNTRNYITSGNAVVWNAAANAAYYNNVAGIGDDTVSTLVQKQSRSQLSNTNNQVIIGLGDIAATNATNTSSLTDGQFLLWGDNNNTQAMTNTTGTYTSFVYAGNINNGRRMNRVWKVQNTNSVGSVKIRFPQASVGTTTLTAVDACGDYAIIYASDSAFTTNVSAAPVTLNGTNYEAQRTFPNGISYFTFGKVAPMNTGIVFLPDTVEVSPQYSDNCTTGPWSYFKRNGDATRKLFATSGLTTANLSHMGVTITPEGTLYDDGVRKTRLMARITTVTDSTHGTYSGVKVRVYYDPAELAATTVPGALTNGWFKYESNADTILIDVYSDGLFKPTKAKAITPDSTGVEDSVNFVEFRNITSFSSFVYLSSTEVASTVLPVGLSQFTAKVQQDHVLLNWSTAQEQNNNGFNVERSTDALNWISLGFVSSKAKQGNSATQLDYAYTDMAPFTGTNYYRLKQTDFNGNYNYSLVQQVLFGKAAGAVTVVPNPVHRDLKIMGLSGHSTIVVTNVFGQILLNTATDNVSEHIIDMYGYIPGTYFVRITGEDHTVSNYTVVKD